MVKKPYLIQRCQIKQPIANRKSRLSEAVEFDYMGSAEFEWGAIPESLRRIDSNQADWKMRLVNDLVVCEGFGSTLRVWSYLSDDDFSKYAIYLQLLRGGKLRTKEHPRFQPNERTNFWYDIENDVMLGFEKNFMNRVGDYVANSVAFINRINRK